MTPDPTALEAQYNRLIAQLRPIVEQAAKYKAMPSPHKAIEMANLIERKLKPLLPAATGGAQGRIKL